MFLNMILGQDTVASMHYLKHKTTPTWLWKGNIYILLVDFSKAFDMVDHELLSRKLEL